MKFMKMHPFHDISLDFSSNFFSDFFQKLFYKKTNFFSPKVAKCQNATTTAGFEYRTIRASCCQFVLMRLCILLASLSVFQVLHLH
jgi:hypothetical protein